MYGQDARQPLEEALDCPRPEYLVDLDDYKLELVQALSCAWKTTSECIKSAQKHQKTVYDRHAKTIDYCVGVGDRVMVHMPHEATGKAAKLARPLFGPYRIVSITSTNVEVRLVDKPDEPTIFVSQNHIRPVIPNYQTCLGMDIPLVREGNEGHLKILIRFLILDQSRGLVLKFNHLTNCRSIDFCHFFVLIE